MTHRPERRLREAERMQGLNPILSAIDEMEARASERHAWLLRAGPIARQMNLESEKDWR